VTRQVIPDVATDEQSQFKQNLAIQAAIRAARNNRLDVMTAARTYYVRTDGSNSNNGLADSASGAFLTLQYAYDYICENIDTAGYTVTINIADGTYAAGVTLQKAWTGGGIFLITGDVTTPDNVVLQASIRPQITLPNVLRISGFKSTSAQSIWHSGTGKIEFSKINFAGTTQTAQIFADNTGAVISAIGDYEISAGHNAHIYITNGSAFQTGAGGAMTTTVTGTPAFTGAFLTQLNNAVSTWRSNTFAGSATGTRYSLYTNATADTNGAGATYLPGDAAGSTATGGQYI
jgi:hypothetical protein